MKKRIISMLLVLVMLVGILPTMAFAASSEEEALGEVDIYNEGTKLSYLSINGRVRELIYTYYNFFRKDGSSKEVPAYCVNPNIVGVPQTVPKGQSIKYLAKEKSSDPKIMGIVANGYPNRGLGELKLQDKYEAYYATKMALWAYILPNWSIANLKVNPNLSGTQLTRAKAVLDAAKNIYSRGTAWSSVLSPSISCTPDKRTAYPVTVDGKEYLQQVFTFSSKTWICNYAVAVAFSDPGSVPSGTRIVNMDNQNITTITTSANGNGYNGKFKVLYPKDSVAGKSGSDQLTFKTNVYQYAIFYAVCAETNKYGTLQNYMVDTDPTTTMQLSAYSSYADSQEEIPETGLKIIKYETGTTIPLEGARFEVIGPNGDTVGYFTSNSAGEVNIPLKIAGNYTIIERDAPEKHLLSKNPTQNVTVVYNEVAKVTFFNDPYGSLRVQKMSDTGEYLQGATIQIKHIESGATYTQQTGSAGVAFFDQLKPGAYEVRELAGVSGWLADTDTIQTINVVAGETSDATIINKELPGLRITKYERGTMREMANVTFEIFRDAESLGMFQTDEFGQILLTDCQPGTYRVEERDTGGDGHVLITTPQEVELKAGVGIKDLIFFNEKLPGIKLWKVDSADLSQPIANAKFSIRAIDGSWGPKEFTTLADGSIDLSMLPVGSYEITELECPGYVIDDAQRIIHITGGDQAQFVFTNSVRPSLKLIKRSADGTPLAGVSYRLSKIEDGSYYLDRTTDSAGEIVWEGLEPGVWSLKELSTLPDHILDTKEYHVELFPGKTSTKVLTNDKRSNLYIHKSDADTGAPVKGAIFLVKGADGHSIAEVETDEAGTAVVRNLLPSVVEIVEKSVPEPYLLDAPSQLVTLWPNRDRDVYFENHKRPVIEIIKENSITHDPISHVRVQVWYASNNTATGEYNDLGIFETDEHGRIELPGSLYGLKDGWFKIKELEPPTGFALTDSSEQTAFVTAGKGHIFTIQNTPLSAIVVWKFDTKTGEALSNCLFEVRYLSGNTSGTGGTVIGQYRTSSNGSFTITGCKAGTYIIEELSSDGSHIISEAPKTVYISGEQQDIVSVYFGNAPKGNILVKKVSSTDGTPLSDVEFLVTKADGSVVGNANGKYVTDSSGSFVIENQEPGTTLIIKETRAKSGYLLDDTPITAVVKAGETVTVEVRNQPKGNLVIEKLDGSDKKTPLEGVRFKITYADGRVVDDKEGKLSSNGIYYTDKNGQIILSNITGTIIVTEEASIKGHTIDPNTRSQTVVVNPDDTQVLRFYNDPISGIIIHKIDSATGEGIYGVKFVLYDSNKKPIGEYTSDDEGYVYIDEIPSGLSGRFYLRELEAADGYILDKQYKTIYVAPGKTVEVEWENTAVTGQIQIYKYAAEYNEVTGTAAGTPLKGAVYEIVNARSGKVVDYITSDARGVAASKPLPLTRYQIREVTAPSFWQIDPTVHDVTLEYPGQIIKLSAYDKAAKLGVSITKRGNAQVMAGQSMRYDLTVANTSNVPLESFFWHDKIPYDVARSTMLTTGTYSARLNYRILYKTNYNASYQVLASNLLTSNNYSFSLNAIPMQAGEVVTDIYFDFGTVPVGFQSVAKPTLSVMVNGSAVNGYQLVNRADAGGKYQGTWQTAQASWVTVIRKLWNTPTLPKTGY